MAFNAAPRDSSVGRAEDCSWLDKPIILGSREAFVLYMTKSQSLYFTVYNIVFLKYYFELL